jgi:hypothetical protein
MPSNEAVRAQRILRRLRGRTRNGEAVMFRHHKHTWGEQYGGIYADKPGGPRYVHELWFRCTGCGKLLPTKTNVDAFERARRADRFNSRERRQGYINMGCD